MTCTRPCLIGIAALLFAAPAMAQEVPAAEPDLPPSVARTVVDLYNDLRRIRMAGPTTIPPDSIVPSDLAVLPGPLELSGTVHGSILVIDGDLILRPGARVTGDILVTGGEVAGVTVADVRGQVLVYPGRLSYRREGDRLIYVEPEPREGLDRAFLPLQDDGDGGDGAPAIDFLMTTGDSYNRVEGLPITFGPRLKIGGERPLEVQALAIYRTESGFTSDFDQVGYYLRADKVVDPAAGWSVGGSAHSLVAPIEDWHLSDLENGLAAFLFHQDFRDHYEREGLSAFVTWTPFGSVLSLTMEGRWERHGSVVEGSPLTLFDNADPWRPQPVVATGRIGTMMLSGVIDTRAGARDPASGWLVRGGIEQALHADLERRGLAGSALPEIPALSYGRFTTGMLDVRKYNRLSPDVRFNLRGMVAGSLTGDPLPPQRQHAFGGEGSLPGYSLFSGDCGARAVEYPRSDATIDDRRTFPYYGCDAMALGQVELRGKLDFRFRLDAAPWDDQSSGGFGWSIAPDWVLFMNGATGWTFDDRPGESFRIDAGAGILVERIGIFAAAPLDGGGFNVFVRLGPRF